MDTTTLWYLIAGLLVLAGLAGILLPALPGLPLVFAGMLLAAWAGGFELIGGWTVLLLAVLTLISVGVDFLASAAGAKRVGASRLAVVGALVGTVVGLFFGLVGVFVGPFVGAVLGELFARRGIGHRDVGQATRVGIGTWFGIFVGTVLKITIAF